MNIKGWTELFDSITPEIVFQTVVIGVGVYLAWAVFIVLATMVMVFTIIKFTK